MNAQKRRLKKISASFFIFNFNKTAAGKLHRSCYDPVCFKTTRAYAHCFGRTVYNSSYFSYVWFPSPVSSSYGVRNIMTERNAFAAKFAFCHDNLTSPLKSTERLNFIITYSAVNCKRLFYIFRYFLQISRQECYKPNIFPANSDIDFKYSPVSMRYFRNS